MADLTFYTNPMSRGRIARWMLEEVGVPYETVLLDSATTMKQEPYLSVNPMGKVPAIVHHGHVVTECAAICAYLADAFPEAGLAPPTSARADYYRWLFFAAGPLEHAITNRSLGVTPTDSQQRLWFVRSCRRYARKGGVGASLFCGRYLYGGGRLCRVASRLGCAIRVAAQARCL